MTFAADTAICRNPVMIYAPIGPEAAVMMSVQAGRYYGLNAVATRIWELLDTPRTIPQLCVQIVEEFEVDAPTSEAAIRSFVADLINNGVAHESAA